MKSLVTAKSTVNKDHRCDSRKMCRDKIGLRVPSYANQNPQCVYNPTGLTLCLWRLVLGCCDSPKLYGISYTVLFFKYMYHLFLFFAVASPQILFFGSLITSVGFVLPAAPVYQQWVHPMCCFVLTVKCNMTEIDFRSF